MTMLNKFRNWDLVHDNDCSHNLCADAINEKVLSSVVDNDILFADNFEMEIGVKNDCFIYHRLIDWSCTHPI